MANLFDSIDASGSGTISQSQFAQAFQSLNPSPSFQAAGADAIWKKLDPNGTGKVSKQDFIDTMTAQMKALRGSHHHRGASQASSAEGAQQLAQSASYLDAVGAASSGTKNVGAFLNTLA